MRFEPVKTPCLLARLELIELARALYFGTLLLDKAEYTSVRDSVSRSLVVVTRASERAPLGEKVFHGDGANRGFANHRGIH